MSKPAVRLHGGRVCPPAVMAQRTTRIRTIRTVRRSQTARIQRSTSTCDLILTRTSYHSYNMLAGTIAVTVALATSVLAQSPLTINTPYVFCIVALGSASPKMCRTARTPASARPP